MNVSMFVISYMGVILWTAHIHLCALKMRMEPLLFADENAPEWAFSKRKGVKSVKTLIRGIMRSGQGSLKIINSEQGKITSF